MYYVGIDVHQKSSSVEILDCNGKLFKRREVRGRWPVLIEELAKVPKPFAVCYEASCGYGYLHEQFSKLAQQVKVAHAGGLSWIGVRGSMTGSTPGSWPSYCSWTRCRRCTFRPKR